MLARSGSNNSFNVINFSFLLFIDSNIVNFSVILTLGSYVYIEDF